MLELFYEHKGLSHSFISTDFEKVNFFSFFFCSLYSFSLTALLSFSHMEVDDRQPDRKKGRKKEKKLTATLQAEVVILYYGRMKNKR